MKQSINIKEIRDIANRFDSDSLEACMQLAMANKANPCYLKAETEEVMNVLAKASFVRDQIEKGASISAALRELGNRIRSIHNSYE